MSLHPLPGAEVAVRWAVVLETAPAVLRPCPRCDRPRPHAPTGAFRTNGHHRRLDVWLLYGCTHCQRTWKLPLHERVAPEALGERLLRYEQNDSELVRELACQLPLLRRHGAELLAPDWSVSSPDLTGLDRVSVRVEGLWQPRLDRLLARALGLSRSRLDRAVRAGSLAVQGGGRKAFRRPLGDAVLRLQLSTLRRHPAEAPAIPWRRPA